MKKAWQILSKEEVFANRWRKIECWSTVTPRGVEVDYFIQRCSDVVVVFGMTADEKVLLLREYFIAAEKYVYSVVAGMVDNSNHAEAAKKELREESGYVSDNWVYLGSLLRGKYATGRVYFYLAKNIIKAGDQELEPAEDIEVSLIPLKEFKELLLTCQIDETMESTCSFLALKYLNLL